MIASLVRRPLVGRFFWGRNKVINLITLIYVNLLHDFNLFKVFIRIGNLFVKDNFFIQSSVNYIIYTYY